MSILPEISLQVKRDTESLMHSSNLMYKDVVIIYNTYVVKVWYICIYSTVKYASSMLWLTSYIKPKFTNDHCPLYSVYSGTLQKDFMW